MTNSQQREIVELRQKLHGLTSSDADLQAAILSTRAALETIKTHPDIESFFLTVRRRASAILAQIR